MPTARDFPQPDDIRVAVFVQWVPLCEIIGRVAKVLRRRQPNHAGLPAIQLCHELVTWVQSLPPYLQLRFQDCRTRGFHRDVHGMHLTYLSTISLLHLSGGAESLPQASTAAIVAASCTARIFHDYLVRGSVSFLAGQAGWYIAIAILALLHARRPDDLMVDAEADVRTLRTALAALSKSWRSAQMFERGITKIMEARSKSRPQSRTETRKTADATDSGPAPLMAPAPEPELGRGLRVSMDDELSAVAGINWQDYFPYVTKETSPLIGSVIQQGGDESVRFAEPGWAMDFASHLNEFLTGDDHINLDFLSL